MHADAEFRISPSVFFALDCESIFLFFEIFQNPFEKFCPGVPWGSPVRYFWVTFALLDFWVKLGFRGRFLTVRPGFRLLGHPMGGGSILIASYRTSPYKIISDSIFDSRVDSGRSSVVGPEFLTIGLPETFPWMISCPMTFI